MARIALLVACLAAVGVGIPCPAAASPVDEANEECIACHSEEEGVLSFGDGPGLSLRVDQEVWAGSAHGGRLLCVDCHRDISAYPHQKTRLASAHAYRAAKSETCRRCHYAYYTRSLDGIHYARAMEGRADAPTCVDCHGSHDIDAAGAPRAEVDRRCALCHADISAAYRQSVHGHALLDENNLDVPVCTDCHGAHAIEDPKTPGFHARSHEVCGQCHGDAEKMGRYGLNPAVLTTYIEDFHGMSNRLYAASSGAPARPMATCTDCHGIHDIVSLKGALGTTAMRERVVQVCRRCHEAVPAAFADAWLSHYEPTLDRAPLVWAVRWGYRILIPFIVLGLVLHILFHLWRVRAHCHGRGPCAP